MSNQSFTVSYLKQPSFLATLAEKYHTDKGSNHFNSAFNKSWPCHTYTDFYERIFGPYRKKVSNVFECGLGSVRTMGVGASPGASLRMWKDYFPNANIYGADIDSSLLFTEDRIYTYEMDQLSSDSVNSVFNSISVKFDIVIDDGLHTLGAASSLFALAFDYLEDGGIYIVEDILQNRVDSYVEWADSTGISYEVISFDPSANKTRLLVFRK